MLIDYVRMIRSNKKLDWDAYMQPEDWDIIDSIILSAKWYPFDFYSRLGWAAFNVVGKGDLEMARLNGQIMAQTLFETTYVSLVKIQDPHQALRKFVLTYSSFFNFSSLQFEEVDSNKVKVHHEYSSEKFFS